MSTPRTLLNALAFQGGWFACVLGGTPWALAAGVLVLPLHLGLSRSRRREAAVLLVCAGIGIAHDLLWQRFGLLRFEGDAIGPLPVWLAVLWLLFSTTLGHSLAWLQSRPLLAAALGAVFGPLSYCAGLRLGAAHSALEYWQVGLVMMPAWLVLLPSLLWISGRALRR
jgi:hypothetical protein